VSIAAASKRLPIVDAFVHARRPPWRRVTLRRRGSDIVATATIYAAALIVTAGFVVASAVDEVLGGGAS
jgi:hypothetical protein